MPEVKKNDHVSRYTEEVRQELVAVFLQSLSSSHVHTWAHMPGVIQEHQCTAREDFPSQATTGFIATTGETGCSWKEILAFGVIMLS